jgi:hypothetical protein
MSVITPTERMPRIEAMRHALSDTRLEGLTIHPNDRALFSMPGLAMNWTYRKPSTVYTNFSMRRFPPSPRMSVRPAPWLPSLPCVWPSCSAMD